MVYQIVVEGSIREDWLDWLSDIQMDRRKDIANRPTITLTGKVIDQAALRGILCRLWDLNLVILSVCRLDLDEDR